MIDRFGRTYAEEAGISLRDTPAPLFQLLCLALLASARIRSSIAVDATQALFAEGWTTPDRLARSTWERRTKVLNHAGYARYDERTVRMLADTTQLLLDRWNGDLRRLRRDAGCDPDQERALLQEFKGIGPVGAEIFAREAQGTWGELYPTVGDRAVRAAQRLGLGDDADSIAALVPRRRLPHLVDGLLRIEFDDAYDQIADGDPSPVRRT